MKKATNKKQTSNVKLEDPTLRQTYRGHASTINSVIFNGNQTQIISGSQDSAVIVWNLSSNKKIRPFKFIGHKAPITDLALHPNAKTIVSASKDYTVRLWSNSVDGKSSVIAAHSGGVRSVDVSADGSFILSGSEDKSIKLWRWINRKFESSLIGHRHWVNSARFSPDGRLVVSGSQDKTVKLWDIAQKSCISSFNDHLAAVSCTRFHADGTCIASCGGDGKIKIFDVRSQRIIQHYDAHNDIINSIAFHPSQNYLISASSDSTLKVFDLRQGLAHYTLHGHQGQVTSVAFSKNGQSFASGSKDMCVMHWRSNLADNSDIDTRSALDKVLLPPHPSKRAVEKKTMAMRSTGIRSPEKVGDLKNEAMTFSNGMLSGQFSREGQEIEQIPQETIVEEAKAMQQFMYLPQHQMKAVNYDKMPIEFANNMHKAIHQLDIISKTVQVLAQRVEKCEQQGQMLNAYVKEAIEAGNQNLDPAMMQTPFKLLKQSSFMEGQLSAIQKLTMQMRGGMMRTLEDSTTAVAPPPTSYKQREFATPNQLFKQMPPNQLFSDGNNNSQREVNQGGDGSFGGENYDNYEKRSEGAAIKVEE